MIRTSDASTGSFFSVSRRLAHERDSHHGGQKRNGGGHGRRRLDVDVINLAESTRKKTRRQASYAEARKKLFFVRRAAAYGGCAQVCGALDLADVPVNVQATTSIQLNKNKTHTTVDDV
ncbi:hypothetical protein RI054_01g00350 [Pseudoscourfieldia marina]